MAELDYAFIAEFAKVENGKLTAVGASYIDVRPPVLPAPHTLSVAGRIRAPEDTKAVGLTIRVNPPGNAMNMVVDWQMEPGPETVPYDGKIGVLFAVSAAILLTTEGLCEVFIDVDKVRQRRLAFRVVAPQ
ncbi:MAG: DUF6941 family protein [Mycobacterium sp.]|uniref:DUF6941 family protein n=1 Tax=Mycobacterium sp. TaxID=1785 RepID=UPI003F94A531